MAQNLRINEQIRISPVRLINQNNEQVGIVATPEALRIAREAGLDLVEVAPQDRPPVCRIMDYGKWKYQQKKRLRGRGATPETQLKELRFRPKTDAHDKQIKLDRAREFLQKGHKVQFTMIFRGRERFHQDLGLNAFLDMADGLSGLAKMERAPKMEGRRLTMVLTPARSSQAVSRQPTERAVQHRAAAE
ncbi:MAG: translation initiation factor IF-3 [Phycisphaerae bacterium]